jgi:hypothetical protein
MGFRSVFVQPHPWRVAVRNSPPKPEGRSAERLDFELYLRTGRELFRREAFEQKFKPYDDRAMASSPARREQVGR